MIILLEAEAGMVIQIEPIDRAISALKVNVITMKLYLHRRMVKPLTNLWLIKMSMLNNLIILCGHYKGN